MNKPFREFADDVLCYGGHLQRLHGVCSVSLVATLSTMKAPYENDWNELVIPYLVERGFAEDDSTLDGWQFRVTGEGFAEIERIHESRRPPSFTDRISSEKFQKIGNLSISVLSLLISLGALAVAVLALSKP